MPSIPRRPGEIPGADAGPRQAHSQPSKLASWSVLGRVHTQKVAVRTHSCLLWPFSRTCRCQAERHTVLRPSTSLQHD